MTLAESLAGFPTYTECNWPATGGCVGILLVLVGHGHGGETTGKRLVLGINVGDRHALGSADREVGALSGAVLTDADR